MSHDVTSLLYCRDACVCLRMLVCDTGGLADNDQRNDVKRNEPGQARDGTERSANHAAIAAELTAYAPPTKGDGAVKSFTT